MRLLFFPGGSYIGGLEIVTLSLMQELQSRGHPCFAVVSGWNNGVYPSKLSAAGIPNQAIKLGRLHLRRPLLNFLGLANFPKASGQLRTVIREFQPDVAILTGIESALTAFHILAPDLPKMLHVHDVPNSHWRRWTGRHVIARTSGIVCVSDFIRNMVVAATQDALPVTTVHNGVPLVGAVQHAPYPKMRIGIIGQLIPRKKHDVLIDAISLLAPEERAQLEVRIYGANATDYGRAMRRKINMLGLEDCFRWMGFVSAQSEIYCDLDIVAAPAVDEPFGTTVLEAGSWGLPVIVARSGGFPEIVLDKETGLLVEPNNARSLAAGISMLLDPSMRCEMNERARHHINHSFGESQAAVKFMRAVEYAVGRKRGA